MWKLLRLRREGSQTPLLEPGIEDEPLNHPPDPTVYVCKDKRGVPCSILRKHPSLTEVRGSLIVHGERNLLTTLKWMVRSCGPQVTINVVGSYRGFMDKILLYALSFMVRWSADPEVDMKILLNGKHLLGYRHENICNSTYRILHLGTCLDLRSSPEYPKLMATPLYDGVRGAKVLSDLPPTLRYYEGALTADSLARLLENFPSLEHVVGGETGIGRWVTPDTVPASLRTLQVWFPAEDYRTIFHQCPNLTVLHTIDSRGNSRTRERPRK